MNIEKKPTTSYWLKIGGGKIQECRSRHSTEVYDGIVKSDSLPARELEFDGWKVSIVGDHNDGAIIVDTKNRTDRRIDRLRFKLQHEMNGMLFLDGNELLDADCRIQFYPGPYYTKVNLRDDFRLQRIVHKRPDLPVNNKFWNTKYGEQNDDDLQLHWVFSDGDVSARLSVNGGDRVVNLNNYDLLSWYSGPISFRISDDATWTAIVDYTESSDGLECDIKVTLVTESLDYPSVRRSLSDFLVKAEMGFFDDWVKWFV